VLRLQIAATILRQSHSKDQLARALRPCAQQSVALPAFMAHGDGVVLQPASQKAP
jgi:hypothetical protein